MSVKIPNETFIEKLFINTLTASGSIPPPIKPEDDSSYRFYHCHLEWNGLHCKRVNSAIILPERDDTKLLLVNKWLPKVVDKYVLKYSFVPKDVYIENK